MKIEIGGGTLEYPEDTAVLDPAHGEGVWRRPAQETPWHAEDDSVEFIRASHVMEHIPAGQDRIDVFNEAWRVLRPGGTFHVIVPLLIGEILDDSGTAVQTLNWPAIADPTHVSFWSKQSFSYFDGTVFYRADYGIKLWTTDYISIKDGWEAHWIGIPQK